MLHNDLYRILEYLRDPPPWINPTLTLEKLGWQITSHVEHFTEGTMYRWRRPATLRALKPFERAENELRLDVFVSNSEHMGVMANIAMRQALSYEAKVIVGDQS